MKFFLISLFIATIALTDTIDIQMNIRVEQNIKALYRDIDLTKEQKTYIEESEEKNINALNKILLKEAHNIYTIKNIDDKNIIQFELNTDGTVNNIELISKSDNKQIDKTTKNTIEKINNQLVLPKEKITLRYIFKYEIKNKNTKVIKNNNEINTNQSSENNEIYINRGTTHFKYDSKEYYRIFNTNEDGFIDVSQEPNSCAKRITILTEKGKNLAEAAGYLFSRINKEAPKGKYKILIQTKQDCNINLQYQ